MSGRTVWRKAGRLLSIDAVTTVVCLLLLVFIVGLGLLADSWPFGFSLLVFMLAGVTVFFAWSVFEDLREPEESTGEGLVDPRLRDAE